MVRDRTSLVVAAFVVAALSAPTGAAAQSTEQPTAAMSQDRGSAGDRRLEDRVFVRLAQRAWAGGDFTVQAEGGTVTVSGTVPSEAARQRIVRIVGKSPGVTTVRDQLHVNPRANTASLTAPDTVLVQRVALAVATTIEGAKAGQDWWLTGWRVEGPDNRWSITVEAEEGDVWLEGEVPNERLIRQAVESARQVSGVRSVRTTLEIDRTTSPHLAYHPYPFFGYHPALYGDDLISPADRQPREQHTITGEVTGLDKKNGRLALTTPRGTLNLYFPPQALRTVEQGDRITVELAMTREP